MRRTGRRQISLVCALVPIAVLGLAGSVEAAPVGQASTAGGTDVATTTAVSGTDATMSGTATRVVQVTDIPMPRDSKVDEDASLVIGGGDRWLGRLVFKVKTNGAETYGYYFNGMVRLGWTRVTAVQSKISTLVFTQGDRVASLQIKGGLGGSTVTAIVTVREKEGG